MLNKDRFLFKKAPILLTGLLAGAYMPLVQAHDPVFGLGPHVLFKDGVEIAPEVHSERAGDTDRSQLGLELTYGLTGDWAAGIDLGYNRVSTATDNFSGQGDTTLFSKYRFWRKDGPGVQQSMSVAAKLKVDTADSQLGSGSTDGLLGLAYGYESRQWYRWAAVRYRLNGENSDGLRRGDKILFDLVGGIRMDRSSYREPDMVWMIELNGETAQRNEFNGSPLSNTGGSEWFVSPGMMWTLRNFAVKAGVQIPLISDLNGNQQATDYRAKLTLEWHL